MEILTASQVIGLWIAGFLTLFIFSFLYRDNPFYKFAEHLYVGVSAGYMMSVDFWNVLKPNLIDRLATAVSSAVSGRIFTKECLYLIPAVLGILMLSRLFPKIGWISRWPLAFIVGVTAGINIVYSMQAQILKQIEATILPLWVKAPPHLVQLKIASLQLFSFTSAVDLSQTVFNWLVVIGVCCGLIYFFFSMEHRGFFGGASRVGIWVLMIAFGAAFGYTVMARVSLLIGRILFFKNEWWEAVKVTFAAILRLFHSG
ncbi:MAG: hypothetical protein V2A78_07600 [bacterium]